MQTEIEPALDEPTRPGAAPDGVEMTAAGASTSAGRAGGASDEDFPAPPQQSAVVAFFWSALSCVEEHLADLFGLNQSKYQWAVDEYMYQERLKQERKRKRHAARREREGEEAQSLSAMEGGSPAEEEAVEASDVRAEGL